MDIDEQIFSKKETGFEVHISANVYRITISSRWVEERFRLDAFRNVVKNGKEKEEKEGAKGSSCQLRRNRGLSKTSVRKKRTLRK